jgi:hypothetical protein
LPFEKTSVHRPRQSPGTGNAAASPRMRPVAMDARCAHLSTHFSDARRACAARVCRWCAGMQIALTIAGVPDFFSNGFNKRGDHVVS